MLHFFFQAAQVQNHLLQIQPVFKGDLLSGVENFKVELDEFADDYHKRY